MRWVEYTDTFVLVDIPALDDCDIEVGWED